MSEKNSSQGLTSVILSSSVGTLIEWYDFYIFGSLAPVISAKFFPGTDPTAALLSTLATFAAGFIVRPFGALFFGRLGDLIGRKYTFLVTLVLMGGATFLIGCIPGYDKIGFLAPILILILRLLQGLALGGEYGGAATYVSEHTTAERRGYWTSWIQTTATLGLFVSLIVIITTQNVLGKEVFNDWGWRVPFWISILLVIVSIIIRLRMKESPMFEKLKSEGKTSTNPLKESFGKKENFRMVLLALFGATMGQGVVWYTGQFYAQIFLKTTCKVESVQVDTWLGYALLLGTGGFILFGWLSDKIGRKVIMMAGMAAALLFTKPLFKSMYDTASAKGKAGSEDLSRRETKETRTLPAGKVDSLVAVDTIKYYSDGSKYTKKIENTLFADATKKPADYKPKVTETMVLGKSALSHIMWCIVALVIFVTMVYGPIAAFLVELFPTRIRYSSMSLPYHIGNGVFGGLVPFIGTLIASYSPNDPFAGLMYPMTITALCFIIGSFFLSNKINEDVTD
jgi:MFS family permease